MIGVVLDLKSSLHLESREMAGLLRRRFLALDVAIAIVAICLAATIVWKFILKRDAAPVGLSVPINTRINLAGFDFQGSAETLVLVLQKDCRFCSMSAPFYRRLLAEYSGKPNLRIIAALPHSPAVSERYLESLNLSVPVVKEVELAEIKVSATPTLLLLNNEGRVSASWVGMLSRDGEQEVLQTLHRDNEP